jgi:hypothetical protein
MLLPAVAQEIMSEAAAELFDLAKAIAGSSKKI